MNRLLALLVDRMSFLKPQEKRRVFAALSSPRDLDALSMDDLSMMIDRPLSRREWHVPLELRSAEFAERWIEKHNVFLLTEVHPAYPDLLGEIYDPPFLLYVRGENTALAECEIAVVGTRRPDSAAGEAAYTFGAEAAEAGRCLVSGLARGIDSMVHRGAVSARGRGVAVLGSGIDSIYPRENRNLALALLDRGGAIVSEYPPGVPPLKYHFPARNRIISGLARGVVVVQAPERSGALITVDHALEQGRDVFVHRAGIGNVEVGVDPRSAGGARLVESGAPVVSGYAEVADALGIRAPRPKVRSDRPERRGTGNALADRMARQLSLGEEETQW